MRIDSSCSCALPARPMPPRQLVDGADDDVRQLLVGENLVAYTDVGEGTPVILVHGSASSHTQWDTLTRQLSNRYRVLAVDLHGYGANRKWTSRTHMQIAHDVAIVTALAALLEEPVHLVGHAYGGTVCLEAALELQSQVLSMSLFEPAALHLLKDAQDQTGWREIAQIAERHIELTWQGDLDASAEVFMNYLSGAGTWSSLPQDRRKQIARHIPKVASEWLLALETQWERDRYAELHIPTLLMRGTRTPRAAKQMVDELRTAVPESAVVEIPGAAHLAPITHSYAVNDAIVTHLWKNTQCFGGVC